MIKSDQLLPGVQQQTMFELRALFDATNQRPTAQDRTVLELPRIERNELPLADTREGN